MKGDFTRLTQGRRFSGVRLQQGRVQLDADFNEQVEIGTRRDRLTTLDAVGRCGVPDEGGGFEILAVADLAGVDVAGSTARAVGSAGAVLASSDGGSTWVAQPAAPGGADLHAVALRPGGGAVAVGRKVTLLESGGSWSAVEVEAELHAVFCADAKHAWAVGEGAAILASSDGGKTWSTQKAPEGVPAALRGVCFRDAKRGWAVGDRGTLIATADGGASWARVAAPEGFGADLRAVACGEEEAVWAVGADGAILRSADDGASWTQIGAPAGVGATLRSVDVSGELVLAVGEGPTAIASEDGGLEWSELELPAVGDLAAVALSGAGAVAVGELSTAIVGGKKGWKAAQLPKSARDLGVGAGRIYVEGTLAEAEVSVRLGEQPFLPGYELPQEPGRYLAYVDVWERHLTALEEAGLREVALGGPDTATRTQTVWQVRLDGPHAAKTECDDIDIDWTPAEPSTGELRARAEPAPIAAGECMVPEGGGYRRLENQLYRVEVIDAGESGAATFAWSRDNGAVLSRLERIDPDPADPERSILTLEHPGRDEVSGFAGADFVVELNDEGRALRGEPGLLLDAVAGEGKHVTVDNPAGGAAALSGFGPGATVRRWEARSQLVANGWQDLEDGIGVQFGAGSYRTGDYWTIPARTIDASVEWPSDDGVPRFERAHGVARAHCRLAIVERGKDGAWTVVDDCRPLFTALADQTRLGMAGGDGQQLLPDDKDSTLPHKLEAMVMNGRRPLDGAQVRFAIEEGGGSLSPKGGSGGILADVRTDGRGIASCHWRLDRANRRHRVRAELLDREGAPLDAPLHFNATVAAAAVGGSGPCTVTARPGDDLREAIEQVREAGGGELCLAAGLYELAEPLRLEGLENVLVSGRGPATVLRVVEGTAALEAVKCRGLGFRHLRVEGGRGRGEKEEHPAVLRFERCERIAIADCELTCPDARSSRSRTACVAVLNGGGREGLEYDLAIERCQLQVGLAQIGIEVAGTDRVRIVDNLILTPEPETPEKFWPENPDGESYAMWTGILMREGGDARISFNGVGYAVRGIVLEGMWRVKAEGNSIGCVVKPPRDQEIPDEARPVALRLQDVQLPEATGNSAGLFHDWATDAKKAFHYREVAGIEALGGVGQFLLIRHSELGGFPTGIRVELSRESIGLWGDRDEKSGSNLEGGRGDSMWLVAETFARDAVYAVDVPEQVMRERNFGTYAGMFD